MRITLAEGAGFCPGVARADRAVRECIRDRAPGEHIATLGALIHNQLYLDALAGEGVHVLSLSEVAPYIAALPPGETLTLFIRTHGIPLPEEEQLRALAAANPALHLRDLTCGSVKAIHRIAAEHTGEDTCFLLFCHPDHPEARGIMSYARGEKHAFSSLDELKRLNFGDKTPILCAQTTENLVEYEKIKLFLKKLYTNAIFFDTICGVTEKRQNEAIRLAGLSDAMIVIGDGRSSNTEKLYTLCHAHCENSCRIERASELVPARFLGAQNIGITAGASTPRGIITEVLNTMEDFNTLLEGSLKTLHTGETVTGTVVTINDNEIALDLGAKMTGVLTKEQITDDPAAKLTDMFHEGDQVDVFVIRVDDGKGIATVSKKRVDADNNWIVLKEAFEAGTILEGKVVAVNKGGVVVSVNSNSVFVPASQTGIAKGGDLSVLVGTVQKIKLLEFDEAKKRALGSIRVVLNEERRAREDAVWATLEVGQHFKGVVKNLTNYGAFVDIGGVDGMVHNSELSWKRIKHPSQVVSVGQEIDVYIKDLDTEKKRISLGYKTQDMDAWYHFTQQFHEGDIVPAKIVSIMPFGAFAEVYEDVDGLIHISRISSQRINSPADVLSVGQVVDVKITEIDNENRKLALSIRAVTEAAERAAAAEARAAEDAERRAAEAEEARRLAEERADMAPYIVGSID